MTITETPGRQENKGRSAARNNNFYPLRQGGILGVQPEVSFGPGSIPISVYAQDRPDRTERGKVKHVFEQVKALLGIDSMSQVPALIEDSEARTKAKNNAYELIGNMYGIEKTPDHHETDEEREARLERIEERVKGYAQTANGVVDRLGDMLSASQVNLATTNVVRDMYDPIDLILLTLNNRYEKKARFEAKRKLVLMNLAAKIDRREKEIDIDGKYQQLNHFLDNHVFSDGKIGEAQDVVLFTTHDEEKFAVTSTSIISPQQAMQTELHPGEKITPLKRRKFIADGREVSVQIDTRKKDAVSKVIKLLRKGKENPAVAVDDEVGFIAVFDSTRDIGAFKRHLNSSARRAGSLLEIEEVENALDGSGHEPQSPGSSRDLKQDKQHITLSGITVEAIFHTNASFVNYRYEHGIGHEEFNIQRNFDSGVIELIYPTDIFPYDETRMREFSISEVRSKIEAPH